MTSLFSGRSPETLDLLLRRRSSSAKAMRAPGPGPEEIQLILRAGTRVPDHGKLAPWRFILFEGEARAAFGALLARILLQREPEAGEVRAEIERNRFLRAPLEIAVISSPKPGKPIPEWEQRLSAGAVCQNMVIAATALGFGAQWVTEWCAYDAEVSAALGLTAEERVAGFLYFGTPAEPLSERERPELAQLVQTWRLAEHRS
jgi:nitroreductase